jgi:hypothetical protein
VQLCRKRSEGLLRNFTYSTLWHKCESPITVLKILYTLAGGTLNGEALCFRLSSLYVNPALIGTRWSSAQCGVSIGNRHHQLTVICCKVKNYVLKFFPLRSRLLENLLKVSLKTIFCCIFIGEEEILLSFHVLCSYFMWCPVIPYKDQTVRKVHMLQKNKINKLKKTHTHKMTRVSCLQNASHYLVYVALCGEMYKPWHGTKN